MKKTKVIFLQSDTKYFEYEKGDTGYIDGYVVIDEVPYMAVINLRRMMPCLVMFTGIVSVVSANEKADR